MSSGYSRVIVLGRAKDVGVQIVLPQSCRAGRFHHGVDHRRRSGRAGLPDVNILNVLGTRVTCMTRALRLGYCAGARRGLGAGALAGASASMGALNPRNRSALPRTKTLDSAMAPAAKIGDRSKPKAG